MMEYSFRRSLGVSLLSGVASSVLMFIPLFLGLSSISGGIGIILIILIAPFVIFLLGPILGVIIWERYISKSDVWDNKEIVLFTVIEPIIYTALLFLDLGDVGRVIRGAISAPFFLLGEFIGGGELGTFRSSIAIFGAAAIYTFVVTMIVTFLEKKTELI